MGTAVSRPALIMVFITIISIGTFGGKRNATANLVARLEDDVIIIERDMNNKILLDALVQAGIPREKIIVAYLGQTVPQPAGDAAR